MTIAETSRAFRSATAITGFSDNDLTLLSTLARRSVFQVCLDAENGHIGGSSAAAELLVTLYFGGILRVDVADPAHSERDRVLIRGHLGPLRYTIFSWLKWIEEYELRDYRRLGSRLAGHEDHDETPGVDITPSGSLGMLLSNGVGAAIAARDTGSDFRTFVFIGDGESQEGNVSEAARHAAHLRLGNLVAILDCNGKQLSNPVGDVDGSDTATIWRGYGWNVIMVQGHDVRAICDAYRAAIAYGATRQRPTLIIAETVKGLGLDGAEAHFSGYHTYGRTTPEVIRAGIEAIDAATDGATKERVFAKVHRLRTPLSRSGSEKVWRPAVLRIEPTNTTPNNPDDGQFTFFRAFGRLVTQCAVPEGSLYFLTADTTTASVVEALGLADTFHFHNVGIREQHMMALAHGLSLTRPDARILINSFDAFTFRCLDQINAAVMGGSSFVILGDVAGITNARNGKTHQTIGLPMALQAIPGLTFLEPFDIRDTFNCLNWALGESRGVVYIRIHSSTVTEFCEHNGRTLTYYTAREAENPDVVLVASGLTVGSCLQAATRLHEDGLKARVVNVINPGTLDAHFVELLAGKPTLTVYNGHPATLRRVVIEAAMDCSVGLPACRALGFTHGTTGTYAELLEWSGLDGQSVYHSARELVRI